MSAISQQDWQDQEDGRALRELDAAWSGTWSLHAVKHVGRTIGYVVEAWRSGEKAFGVDDDSMPDHHPTIADAADACRAALRERA